MDKFFSLFKHEINIEKYAKSVVRDRFNTMWQSVERNHLMNKKIYCLDNIHIYVHICL